MASYPTPAEGPANFPDIMPVVFGTARYGADKIDGKIVPTPGPHHEEVALLREAVARGYNFIDTAQGYGDSELIVGRALSPALRDEVVIATKVGMQPEPNITGSIINSVRRLDTEPDVLYVHTRWDGVLDGSMDDCLEAVDHAVDVGLAGSIGISNFHPAELQYAIDNLRNPVEFYQAKVNLHSPRSDAAELLELCRSHDIIFTASSALDRGAVIEDASPELVAMAQRYDSTIAQLAVTGLRSIGMYPVIMTKNPNHMDENMAALSLDLDAEDTEHLAGILLSRQSLE